MSILRGTCHGENKNGETPKQTLIREIGEEIKLKNSQSLVPDLETLILKNKMVLGRWLKGKKVIADEFKLVEV